MRSRFKSIIKSERPVLVSFYADWCHPCKELQPILKEVKEHFKENIRIVKVNVDSKPLIASLCQVSGIPTLILFKQGTARWTGIGVINKPELTSVIEKYVNQTLDI